MAVSLRAIFDVHGAHRSGNLQHVSRDLPWDAMVTVAEKLEPLTEGTTLTVRARRRRSLLRVTEGLEVVDNWTDVFEPVRWRWWWISPLADRWSEVQPVQTAASHIGSFLRERPDQV